jgi:hypothetical protein
LHILSAGPCCLPSTISRLRSPGMRHNNYTGRKAQC